eukprot:TRINITY_DN12556_c0_g2_i19.p2 TRINITY_DN12556_c0_g2~~TRINITY_DN12556_c0_g2_i19.p2  ORF type:complete len:651 (+),score=145.23 TRINITY_DN12556_c0_g2_i19:4874-6826(+)
MATGREHWVAAMQSGRGMNQAPRPGAPPYSHGNPATARSAYLTQVMKHAKKTGVLAHPYSQRPVSGSKSRRRPKSAAAAASKRGDGDIIALKEQMLELKKALVNYEQENKTLKSTILQLENTCKRKDNDIEELLEAAKLAQSSRPSTGRALPRPPGMGQAGGDDKHLVISLRHQLTALKSENKSLSSQLDKVARTLKATRIEELELEVTQYYQEVLRLRLLLRENGVNTTKTNRKLKTVSLEDDGDPSYITKDSQQYKAMKEQLDKSRASAESLQQDLNAAMSAIEKLKEDFEAQRRELGGEEGSPGELQRLSRKELLAKAQTQQQTIKEFKSKLASTNKTKNQSESERDKLRQELSQLEEANGRQREEQQRNKSALKRQKQELKELKEANVNLLAKNTSLSEQFADALKASQDIDVAGQLAPMLKAQTAALESQLKQLSKLDTIEPLLQSQATSLQEQIKSLHSQAAEQANALTKAADQAQIQAEESHAAVKLQSSWRRYQAQKELKKRKLSKAEKDECIRTLQAVFRGHLARVKLAESLQAAGWSDHAENSNADEIAGQPFAAKPPNRPKSDIGSRPRRSQMTERRAQSAQPQATTSSPRSTDAHSRTVSPSIASSNAIDSDTTDDDLTDEVAEDLDLTLRVSDDDEF